MLSRVEGARGMALLVGLLNHGKININIVVSIEIMIIYYCYLLTFEKSCIY